MHILFNTSWRTWQNVQWLALPQPLQSLRRSQVNIEYSSIYRSVKIFCMHSVSYRECICTIVRTHTNWEITWFSARHPLGSRDHEATDQMVPRAPAVADLGIVWFLNEYWFLLLSHDPWEWGPLGVGESLNSQQPNFSSDFDTGHGITYISRKVKIFLVTNSQDHPVVELRLIWLWLWWIWGVSLEKWRFSCMA